jgi:hypothetical protein
VGVGVAFDVQVPPFKSKHEIRGDVACQRIPLIEVGQRAAIRAVDDTPEGGIDKDGLKVYEAIVFDELKERATFSVTCRSLNNQEHSFRFERTAKGETKRLCFILAEHT